MAKEWRPTGFRAPQEMTEANCLNGDGNHHPADGLPILGEYGFYDHQNGTPYTGANALAQTLSTRAGIVISRSPIARGMPREMKEKGIRGYGMLGKRKGGRQLTTLYPAQDCFKKIWHLIKVHTEIIAHARQDIGIRIWRILEKYESEPTEEAIDEIIKTIRTKTYKLPKIELSAEEEESLDKLIPQMEAGFDGYGVDYSDESRCTLDAYLEKNEITKEELTISTFRREVRFAALDFVLGIDRNGRIDREMYKPEDLDKLRERLKRKVINEEGFYMEEETDTLWALHRYWLKRFGINHTPFTTAIGRLGRNIKTKKIKSQRGQHEKCFSEAEIIEALTKWAENHPHKKIGTAKLKNWNAKGLLKLTPSTRVEQ